MYEHDLGGRINELSSCTTDVRTIDHTGLSTDYIVLS